MSFSETSILKKSLGILVFAGLFFAFGYYIGLTPDFYDETMTIGRKVPRVYIESKDYMDEDLLEKLKKISHIDFEVTDSDFASADLWITEKTFLKSPSIPPLPYHKLDNPAVSPDFKIEALARFSSLPIAWRISDKKMQIIVVTAPIQKRSKQSRPTQMLVHSLLSNDFQLESVQHHKDWNTTLLSLDESNIPANRKSSHIRSQSLYKELQ